MLYTVGPANTPSGRVGNDRGLVIKLAKQSPETRTRICVLICVSVISLVRAATVESLPAGCSLGVLYSTNPSLDGRGDAPLGLRMFQLLRMCLRFHGCTLPFEKALVAICCWRPKEKDIGPLPGYCTATVHSLHDSSLTLAENSPSAGLWQQTEDENLQNTAANCN